MDMAVFKDLSEKEPQVCKYQNRKKNNVIHNIYFFTKHFYFTTRGTGTENPDALK